MIRALLALWPFGFALIVLLGGGIVLLVRWIDRRPR